jgi:hypothetical protein
MGFRRLRYRKEDVPPGDVFGTGWKRFGDLYLQQPIFVDSEAPPCLEVDDQASNAALSLDM